MFWRTVLCLLALSLLIAAHPALVGQSAVHPAPLPKHTPIDFAPEHFPPEYVPVHPPITPSPPARLPTPVSFPGIARAAGMIFSGTVRSVERRPATRGSAVETVAITFHVESSLRGAAPGEDLTISQWIGLWTSGQHVLMFLYPSSKLGLTSSVAGPLGRFNVDARGRVLLSAHHLAAFRTDPVLGGKPRVRVSDFALAVRKACEEE